MEILEIYTRMLKRYPLTITVVLLGYGLLLMLYIVGRGNIGEVFRAPSERAELQKRVLQLEQELQEQRQVIAAVSTRGQAAELLKPLRFEEQWRNETSRAAVDRLIEYGEFALSKKDYAHAEQFYAEATQIQPTITVPYYQGRLAYIQGDLKRAEARLLEAQRRDSAGRYPDIRLYLGILYYQLGRVDDARASLSAYLAAR